MSDFSKKLCLALEKDLKESNLKYETVKYFRQNMISVIIWISTMSYFYNKKELNAEDIYRIVNEIVRTSRPSVMKYLGEAKQKKYLQFTMSRNDKRAYSITPSEITIYEFEKWSEVFRI